MDKGLNLGLEMQSNQKALLIFGGPARQRFFFSVELFVCSKNLTKVCFKIEKFSSNYLTSKRDLLSPVYRGYIY